MKSTRLLGAKIPAGVADLPDPPAALFLTGRVPPGPRVAVVGTRRPTPQASDFAFELAHELAQTGVVVVSGGALGIDTAAHEGALRAGGATLVVAPSSYCCPYPEQNRDLFREVVRGGGGFLSAFDEPTPARRHAFFARNALLVSLCSTIILVQAPFRSGARNALLWARRLRKTAWIVPHPPWCTRSGASIPELRLGGLPLARARDVMQWLSQRQLHAVPPQAVNPSSVNPIAAARIAGSPASRQGAEQADVERLVAHLRASAGTRATEHPPEAGVDAAELHPDILCRELAWDAARLNAAVLYATLQGEVERRPSGNIACTRCRHGA